MRRKSIENPDLLGLGPRLLSPALISRGRPSAQRLALTEGGFEILRSPKPSTHSAVDPHGHIILWLTIIGSDSITCEPFHTSTENSYRFETFYRPYPTPAASCHVESSLPCTVRCATLSPHSIITSARFYDPNHGMIVGVQLWEQPIGIAPQPIIAEEHACKVALLTCNAGALDAF